MYFSFLPLFCCACMLVLNKIVETIFVSLKQQLRRHWISKSIGCTLVANENDTKRENKTWVSYLQISKK